MWHRIETAMAVVVSVLALVLSQLPPLHTYFTKPNITVSLPSRPVISHRFGHLYACCFLQAFNQGDAPGRIGKLRIYITKKDSAGFRTILTGTSLREYSKVEGSRAPLDLPLGEVTVQPGENWQGEIVFTPSLSTKEEEEVARFEDEIFSQIRLSGKLSIIDRDLYNEIEGYCQSHLASVSTGEYYMLIVISESGATEERLLLYSFSVYDFDLRELRRITEKYRMGYGVTSFDDLYSQGFQARIAAIDDNDVAMTLVRASFCSD